METEKILWKCDFCKDNAEATWTDVHITLNKEENELLILCNFCYQNYKKEY